MGTNAIRRNERDWAGQLISWLKSAIEKRVTIFQDATNDTGIKLDSGRTKFPDILLFVDKISGVVFNGWELKFPDTPADDPVMLENALEKAKKLKADSFVTWNGAEAVIWKVDTENYSVGTLSRLKVYPRIAGITCRDDMADPQKYALHEGELKELALEILHDLDQFYTNGHLKPAIDISSNIIQAIRDAGNLIIPQLAQAITDECGLSKKFRDEFARWKIYESSTLKILESSSRREERVLPEQVLAKFTFYNLIGKILFYLTLSENLSGELDTLSVPKAGDIKDCLERHFNDAGRIDYQAIFKPYFTDGITYSATTEAALLRLVETLTQFDFKVLPTSVIGNILENLVPHDEKQKLGQYFTPETLANLVAFPVVRTRKDVLFDPTSGTGTFLHAFYKILQFHGNNVHADLLGQIWGNDVSHFPAILSVINLYKQDVTETDNFPRVSRDDFFNLEVGKAMCFPSPHNHKERIDVPVPVFDGIASNFPFIQQEDIPNDKLTTHFRQKFEKGQRAFLRDGSFKINERSDYFTYCVYNSIRFLKPDGCLAAITSNAWLGKEYGFQFKQFLLDNFHIKYVVKSSAEHWFKDSLVSTVYIVLERSREKLPTRFVTVNAKLTECFDSNDIRMQLDGIERFYAEVDYCDDAPNGNWEKDKIFSGLWRKKDGMANVCVVPEKVLAGSIATKDNWEKFFISTDLFGSFDKCLTRYHPNIVNVIRGERTGWNDMFVIKTKDVPSTGIASEYLVPYVKSPSELNSVDFSEAYQYQLFVCEAAPAKMDKGTKGWIERFRHMRNRNKTKTIEEACSGRHPFWYSLRPKRANIITAINPYERFFFTYSKKGFAIDQRLIALQVQDGYDVELTAALLNSAITFLVLEMRGTSRNLGALDLNANYLKTLRVLNPALLTEEQKKMILEAFQGLKGKTVGKITDEIKKPERIKFDKTVLKCFGLDVSLLQSIYDLLESSVTQRVTMSER